MVLPHELPQAKLCDSCLQLFTKWKDDPNTYGPSIQEQIFEGGGYIQRRTRRDLEGAYLFGCLFCTEVMREDTEYCKEIVDTFSIPNVHPLWYPSLDDIVTYQVEYVPYFEKKGDLSRVRFWTGEFGRGCLSFQPIQSLDGAMKAIREATTVTYNLRTVPDDPATKFIRTKPLTHLIDPSSKAGFDIMKGWISSCDENHSKCSNFTSMSVLPRRLIELSVLGHGEVTRVIDTKHESFLERQAMEPSLGLYVALIYCWGGPQPFSTRLGNVDSYSRDLPCEKLPRTILDAFLVARGLGICFIWIDSICIIQDSQDDVAKEMANMKSIYHNALFTISAASASSCHDGFLDTRQAGGSRGDDFGPFSQTLRIAEDTIGIMVITSTGWISNLLNQEAPINKRGWTLQESLLSRRLLTFAGYNMPIAWKCQEGLQSLNNILDPDCRIWLRGAGYPEDETRRQAGLDILPENMEETSQKMFQDWQRVLENYTSRVSTNERDRLPAISAVAEEFSQFCGGIYLAGLWQKHLVIDLLWMTFRPQIVEGVFVAPTWSWASTGGKITYLYPHLASRVSEFSPDIEIMSCNVQLQSETAVFGCVTMGGACGSWTAPESKARRRKVQKI